ncbi:MAG: hypothetical protein WD470_13030 [Rhodospirillaceae bacterium]
MTPASPPTVGKPYWLDDPRSVDKVYWGMIIASAAVFLLDAFYTKHPAFAVERVFGFYGLYGFAVCAGLIFLARALRATVARPPDFYDEKAEPGSKV